ncbi:anti-sigma factor [Marinobacter sp. SS5-14b]|uniref:anti-sigma factor family protein n=1 Tax=Marinobacter sp. SS5-14b TaxID=3050456 RepID=UPI0026DF727F|nr:zf-HC2 domain-containing protein [Marinobacter sp. SS5-14b]
MSCSQIRSQLSDLVRNQLASGEAQQVRAHLEHCQSCARQAEIEAVLKDELTSRYAVPAASADFESRVLAAASGSGQGRKVHLAWGGAVAAALVLGLMLGRGMPDPEPQLASEPAPAELSDGPMPEPVDRTVRLAFTAGEPLDDVTLTLALPPHVELSGLPGQHRVSWQVSLEQGDNVLALPLKILFPGAGELIAELDANGRQKVFRAVVPQHPGNSVPNEQEEPAT